MRLNTAFIKVIDAVKNTCDSTEGCCDKCKLEKVCDKHFYDLPYNVLKELRDAMLNN